MIQSRFSENNDLEQHLRSELRDYAPDAPDRLWAGIEARLPQRRRRRPVLWWWLTGVAITSFISGMAFHFGAEKPIVRNLSAHSIVLVPASLTDVRPIGLAMPIANQAYPVPASAERPMTNAIASGSPNKQESLADNLLIKTSFANLENLQGQSLITATVPHLPLLFLPSGVFPPLRHETKSTLNFLASGAQIEPVKERRWQIGAVAGPVWQWQQPVTGAPGYTNHLSFTERSEGPASGWQAGLSAHIVLRQRWRLSSGLWRRTTTQISFHTAELRLMDGVCLNPSDPGPKVYEFQYALHSSGNESNLTVRIAQVDTLSTMPTDEPFMLTMRTSRQRTEWVLPLTLQRSFGRGRWQGFVEGGGALNVPGIIAVQVEHFSEECADLCYASNHMPTLTNQERGEVSLSWLLGAGIDYRLGRHWSLSASPTLFGQRGQTGMLLNTSINLQF